MGWLRIIARPIGYLAFIVALVALSLTARVLGDRDELGFFAQRLADALWRYPEVTRPGIMTAWVAWFVLFAVALSPFDPLSTRWDEVVLGALGLGVAWRSLVAARPASN